MEGVEMDYVNFGVVEDEKKGKTNGEKHDSSGIRVYKVVGVSFGLLCVLQASLNIALRLLPLSSGSVGSATAQSCPPGWTNDSSSCYLVSSAKKGWEEAKQDCLERGGHLVVINSKEKQEVVQRTIGINDGRVWIGLTDADTGESWAWVDGTPLTVQYWAGLQPDNRHNGYGSGWTDEDCVYIYHHNPVTASWSDELCDMALQWMCEKAVK